MILITGAARSGTTLTTSIIEACGGVTGDVSQLREHKGVKEAQKEALRSFGYDPLGQYPLPDQEIDTEQLREKILYHTQGIDTLKEAKATLMWRVFHELFPDAKWVLVRRDRDRIVASCKRTNFMKKAPDWYKWAEHYEKQLEAMKNDVVYREVWPDRLVRQGDDSDFRALIDWLGLEWNEQAVQSIVDPNKWH
jgi:hypothetical protein